MAMWIAVSMWTAFFASFLLCTTAIHSTHSNFPDFDTPKQGQYLGSHKGSFSHTNPSWSELNEDASNYLYGAMDKDGLGQTAATRNGFLTLNSWPDSDSVTMARQILGDSSDSINSHSGADNDVVSDEDMPKAKRNGHSLSIVNPIEVLRQRLMLEMARRRMQENEKQIQQNDIILKNLGKRSASFDGGENFDIANGSGKRTKDYLRTLQITDPEDFEV
ncbi:uncharacterized protein LOC118196806 [Stegodyphus dumicola]|uniref:uncharacterized protein LOC118196806 n=1 Tax=Stegodyphus dumicola TaxID=202533 RepID=UPI0015A9099A|nr:uncharacterized protein LOC118196806 [Stegodyphus dumicola]